MKTLKTGVLCLSPLVHIPGDMHKNKVIEKIDMGGILYLRPRRQFTSLRHCGLEPTLSPNGTESALETSTIQSLNSFLGLSLTTQDISAIHRTSKPRSQTVSTSNAAAPSSNRPPPVIVQFVNKKVSQRRSLKTETSERQTSCDHRTTDKK